jgi:NitT/TauT family transport system substrate-binding protein
MVGSGEYREVAPATEMLAQLGLSPDLPILMVVARDDLEPDLVRAYLSAMNETVARMQQDEGIWELILENELYSLPDPSLFPSVVERWEQGVSQTWNQEVIGELVAMLDSMIALAGPDIVGLAEVSPDAFTAEFVP